MFKWGKYSRGYDVSEHGDQRFSEKFALLPGGRTIREIYNCDVKGYAPGGTHWQLGFDKPPLDRTVDLWEAYVALWREWANCNPHLIEELKVLAMYHDFSVTDKDATTNVNAARALVTILNERYAETANNVTLGQPQMLNNGMVPYQHMNGQPVLVYQ